MDGQTKMDRWMDERSDRHTHTDRQTHRQEVVPYLTSPELVTVVGVKQNSFSCVTFLSKNLQVNFSIGLGIINITRVDKYVVFKD